MNFYKQAIPIVNYYNGRDHYAQSCCVSAKLHNDFKIGCFKEPGAKTVEVLEEIDTSFLTISQRNVLTVVQRDIDHCKLVFPPKSAAEAASTAAKSIGRVGPIGPLLKETIPSGSGVPHSSSSTPRKGKKTFVCDVCGAVKPKKQDLEDNLRIILGQGDENPYYCNICKKNFGNKASLKLHDNSLHKNIWLHNCLQCDYKTNNKQQFKSHMKRKRETKEQQELSKTHVCPNCEKGFYINALLQKHLNSDTCNISEKKFECDKCTPSKWFKTDKGLITHIKKYHSHEIALFKCKSCEKLIGSKGAMKRHKQWHWDVEEKRRKRDAKIQREKEKLEELERQKERALKSSPAKIIMTGEWPSVSSTSGKTPRPLPSADTGGSTKSPSHTQSQDSQDTDDYTSKSPESQTEPHIE